MVIDNSDIPPNTETFVESPFDNSPATGSREADREFYVLLFSLVAICGIGTFGVVGVLKYAPSASQTSIVHDLILFLGGGAGTVIAFLKLRRVAIQSKKNYEAIGKAEVSINNNLKAAVVPLHERLNSVEGRINGNAEKLVKTATDAVRAAEHDQLLNETSLPRTKEELDDFVNDIIRRSRAADVPKAGS